MVIKIIAASAVLFLWGLSTLKTEMLSLLQDLKHHWLTDVLTSGARSNKTKVWWYTFERSIWWYLEVLQHLCLVLSFWCWRVSNIPVNMPDPIWKHFGCSQLWPESGQIIYAGSDFLHPVWFLSSKEGPDHTVQNWPRSDLDGLFRFWLNASGPEASGCATCVFFFILILMTFTLLCPLSPKNSFSTLSIQVNGIMRCKHRHHHHQHQESLGLVLAEHKLAHCQFPTCRFGCILPQVVWIMLCKTSLVLADCQVLAKWILSGSKLVCNNHQATSGQWFQADQNLMWLHVYWDCDRLCVCVCVCLCVCVCVCMHAHAHAFYFLYAHFFGKY